MDASAILDELSDLGISVRVDGSDILCRPGGRIPTGLKSQIRANKSAIVAELKLLERLRKGQMWLSNCANSFYDGAPTTTAVRFSEMLDRWVGLEQELRLAYKYTGCIHGPDEACPKDAAVICDACEFMWTACI